MKADRRFAPGFNVRSFIIASQMALSLVLLIPCGLFVRSWLNASAIDPGFATDRVLLLPISTDQSGVRVQKPPGFEQELIDRVAALPGVEAVTAMDPVPLWFGGNYRVLRHRAAAAPSRGSATRALHRDISTRSGCRLLRGRDFTTIRHRLRAAGGHRQRDDGAAVLAGWQRRGREDPPGDSVMEVVGVAQRREVRRVSPTRPSPCCTSRLRRIRRAISTLSLAVRTPGDPMALREPIQREVRALIPSWPAFQFRTLDEGLALQQQLPRFSATLLGLLGSLGLLLAAVGLYGVMTYVVRQRTHEIGIRLALGSPVVRVMTLMVKQGMTVCVAGAAVGMAAAMAVSQFLTSVLYGISPADPLTFALVPLLLIGVGLARLLHSRPARRPRESARGSSPGVALLPRGARKARGGERNHSRHQAVPARLHYFSTTRVDSWEQARTPVDSASSRNSRRLSSCDHNLRAINKLRNPYLAGSNPVSRSNFLH